MLEILSKNIKETNGTFTVTVSRKFKASQEKIYTALTHREHFSRWFGCKVEMAEVATIGSKYAIDFGLEPGPTIGEFLELRPSDLIAFSWNSYDCHEKSAVAVNNTVVRIETKKVTDGTLMTLTHSGFTALSAAHSHEEGWSMYLDLWQEQVQPLEPLRRLGRSETFRYSPEELYKKFTDSNEMSKWFGCPVEADARVGGALKISFDDCPPVTGKYLELDKDNLVRFTWLTPSSEGKPSQNTEIVVKFEPMKNGTRLTLVHFGFASDELKTELYEGWGEYFKAWLKK